MTCNQFVKNGGGRGRPRYNTACASCGVLYTDHPNLYRDRYKNTSAPVILNITGVVATPQLGTQPVPTPIKIS